MNKYKTKDSKRYLALWLQTQPTKEIKEKINEYDDVHDRYEVFFPMLKKYDNDENYLPILSAKDFIPIMINELTRRRKQRIENFLNDDE